MMLTPTMLITDDDRDLRETLGGVFERRGFATLLAENGERAIEIVAHQSVHVALLDMNMPRMSGLGVLQHLHRQQIQLPCILLSANMDAELEDKARAANAYSVRKKPISVADIDELVRQALRHFYEWAAELEN